MYIILNSSGLLIFVYLVVSTILFLTNSISTIGQGNVVNYNFTFSVGLMIGWLVYKHVNRWLYVKGIQPSLLDKNDKVFQRIATILRSINFKFNANNVNLFFFVHL